MWCITLIDLWILNQPCSPGMNPTWSWWIILFICCWILFASILLRIFASVFIRDIGLYFSFFVYGVRSPMLPWFQNCTNIPLKKRTIGQYPWWIWLQKFSIRFYQIEFNSTLKELFTVIKWDLFLDCRATSIFANQSMWYTISIKAMIKTIWFFSIDAEKAFDNIQHSFLIKTLKKLEQRKHTSTS